MDDGSGGDRQKELTSPTDLVKNDWKEIAQLKETHSNDNPMYSTSWHFYSRDCKEGGTFALRNHKYQAPIVLAGITNRRRGPTAEPTLISRPRKRKPERIPVDIRLESRKRDHPFEAEHVRTLEQNQTAKKNSE